MNPVIIDKIISFRSMTSGLEAAASRDILWPCYAFSVFIPHRKKSRLNIFEETILGLSSLGIRDTEELADTTCMEKELVSFIQNRLSLLGFLSSRKEITDTGMAVLAQKESDTERNYVSAWAFMDLTNGKLLPFTMFGSLEYKTLLKNKGGERIEFKIKPTDEWSINAQVIRNNGDFPPPENKELVKAIWKFRERYKLYAAFSGNTAYPPSIPSESSITINKTPTPVYLHCKVILQKSNSDTIVVTDGFGFGYSGSFTAHVKKNEQKIVSDIMRKATMEQFNADDDSQKPVEKKRIHNIARLINEAKGNIEETKKLLGHGDAAGKRAVNEYHYALGKIYEALERTFAQIVFDNGDISLVSIYAGNSFRDNDEILRRYAVKIGLMVNKRNSSILRLKYGNIRLMSSDRIDMHSALALAITGAASSGHHPLNDLAMEYPDILTTLNDFTNLRNPILHGEYISRDMEKRLKHYLEKTEKIITLLLPDIAKQFDSRPKTGNSYFSDIERVYQDRLKACIELDKYFGAIAMCEMERDLKEGLIKLSILEKYKGNEPFPFKSGVNDLASALQIMYHETILSANIFQRKDNSPSEIKSIAFGKAVRAGFAKTIQDIPKIISGVDQDVLKIIMQGRSYSLQSNFIGVLYLCDDEALGKLKKECPDLLTFTAELAELRMHGNRDFSEEKNVFEKFKDLKAKVYKAIKELMEV